MNTQLFLEEGFSLREKRKVFLDGKSFAALRTEYENTANEVDGEGFFENREETIDEAIFTPTHDSLRKLQDQVNDANEHHDSPYNTYTVKQGDIPVNFESVNTSGNITNAQVLAGLQDPSTFGMTEQRAENFLDTQGLDIAIARLKEQSYVFPKNAENGNAQGDINDMFLPITTIDYDNLDSDIIDSMLALYQDRNPSLRMQELINVMKGDNGGNLQEVYLSSLNNKMIAISTSEENKIEYKEQLLGEKMTIAGVDFYMGDNSTAYAQNKIILIKNIDTILADPDIPKSKKELLKKIDFSNENESLILDLQKIVRYDYERSPLADYTQLATQFPIDNRMGPRSLAAFSRFLYLVDNDVADEAGVSQYDEGKPYKQMVSEQLQDDPDLERNNALAGLEEILYLYKDYNRSNPSNKTSLLESIDELLNDPVKFRRIVENITTILKYDSTSEEIYNLNSFVVDRRFGLTSSRESQKQSETRTDQTLEVGGDKFIQISRPYQLVGILSTPHPEDLGLTIKNESGQIDVIRTLNPDDITRVSDRYIYLNGSEPIDLHKIILEETGGGGVVAPLKLAMDVNATKAAIKRIQEASNK